MDCAEPNNGVECLIRATDYDLHATLDSGQTFRWAAGGGSWTGVVGRRWVRLRPADGGILALTTGRPNDWDWLTHYLQTEVDLRSVVARLPDHPYLSAAVRAHRGLRLLRQDPWECLASFILSSTKHIRQIKVVVERLCQAHGDLVQTPAGEPELRAFPSAGQIAALRETDLRRLGMGFRAPYLLATAERIADDRCPLERLREHPIASARAALLTLPGVGRKIADCVLLFSLGFNEAFPVDTWLMKTLQAHWFHGDKVSLRELVRFSETSFGPYGGYAQQYLFHFARTQGAVNGKDSFG